MGLRDLFRRWSTERDADALARAEGESGMTEREREIDQEDYEARKDDVVIGGSWAGSAAEDAAGDDFE
jgi:hypothetical protein